MLKLVFIYFGIYFGFYFGIYFMLCCLVQYNINKIETIIKIN
jgi:hypothetical protein